MRSAPVGALYPPARLDELIRGACDCATHGGQAAGVLYPENVNKEWFAVVERINGVEIVETAKSMAAFCADRRAS